MAWGAKRSSPEPAASTQTDAKSLSHAKSWRKASEKAKIAQVVGGHTAHTTDARQLHLDPKTSLAVPPPRDLQQTVELEGAQGSLEGEALSTRHAPGRAKWKMAGLGTSVRSLIQVKKGEVPENRTDGGAEVDAVSNERATPDMGILRSRHSHEKKHVNQNRAAVLFDDAGHFAPLNSRRHRFDWATLGTMVQCTWFMMSLYSLCYWLAGLARRLVRR